MLYYENCGQIEELKISGIRQIILFLTAHGKSFGSGVTAAAFGKENTSELQTRQIKHIALNMR